MSIKLKEHVVHATTRPWKFTYENKFITRKFCTKIDVAKMPGNKIKVDQKTVLVSTLLKLGILYDRIVSLYNFDDHDVRFEFFIYVNNTSLLQRIRHLKNSHISMHTIKGKVFYIHKTNLILCSVSSVDEFMMAQAMLSHLFCYHFGFDKYEQYFNSLTGHLLKQHLQFNLKRKNPIKKGVVR